MTQSEQEQIEAYLLERCSPEERAAFELRLAADPALAETVRLHHKMMQGVEELGFRAMLDEIHAAGNPRVVPWYQQPRILSIAAVVLLLLSFAWIWLPQRQPAGQWAGIELAPGLPTTLGPAATVAFDEGMNAYKLGQYAEAESYWLPLLEARPTADTLLFFLGQTALAQQQDRLAIERLEAVRRQAESPWQLDASWYLALAHLRQDDQAAARPLLEALQGSPNKWQQAAADLLITLQP